MNGPQEVGVLGQQARGLPVNVHAVLRHGDHPDALGSGVGGHDFAVARVHRVQDGDGGAAGDTAGHQRGLCQRGGAVIHACVGDLHAGQKAHHGLEVVGGLEGALADLRLVGGVGGEQLASGDDGAHDAGDEVPVGAAAEEAGVVARDQVLLGDGGELLLKLHLGEGWWQVQGGVSKFGWDVVEELVNGRRADGPEHCLALGFCVGEVGMLEGRGHWVLRYSAWAARCCSYSAGVRSFSSSAASLRRTLTSQP